MLPASDFAYSSLRSFHEVFLPSGQRTRVNLGTRVNKQARPSKEFPFGRAQSRGVHSPDISVRMALSNELRPSVYFSGLDYLKVRVNSTIIQRSLSVNFSLYEGIGFLPSVVSQYNSPSVLF